MNTEHIPHLPQAYRTKQVQLQLEHLHVELSLIENLDELISELLGKEADHEDLLDERIPYWAELWPSARVLSRHLIAVQVLLSGKSVLEVGCGLGLPGIVAGMLGAEKVCMTDYLPDALVFARHNWEQNLNTPACFELLDWRTPTPALAADIVLASDIAYEKRAFEFLPSALRALCRPGGLILVADPSRSSAPEFFGNLPQQGFSVEVFQYIEPYNGHNFRVQVYALKPL